MTTTAWFTAGTGSNVDRDSKSDWSNPSNVTSEDTNYATNTVVKNDYSDWIYASDFGFDGGGGVPSGATIDGIEMQFKRYSDTYLTTYCSDGAIYLVDSTGTQQGDDYAAAGNWPGSNTMSSVYGGSSDTWNASLDAADIRSSSFGVQISVDGGASGDLDAYIDVVQIRITYTATGDLEVTESDTVTISDSPTVELPGYPLSISVSDTVTASDTSYVAMLAVDVEITSVGTDNGYFVTTLDSSGTTSFGPGDYVVVCYAGSSDDATKSIACGGATFSTFTRHINTGANGIFAEIWAAKCTAGGTTDNITLSQLPYDRKSAAFYKVRGLDQDSPFDESASATGTSTTANSTATGTLSSDDELGVACIAVEAGTSDTPGSWTTGSTYISGNEQYDANTTTSDGAAVYSAAEILSATTAQTAEVDGFTSRDWAAVVATFLGYEPPVGDLSVSVSDTVTVSDSATVEDIPNPEVSDNVTVSDSATVALEDLVVGVSDTVTTSDTATVTLPDLNISGAESVTVSDTPVVALEGLVVGKSDSVTASDDAVVALEDSVVVESDNVTISDDPTVVLESLSSAVADTVSVSDAVSAAFILEVSESDNVTVSDDATVDVEGEPALEVSVNDTITVSATVRHFSELVIVRDSAIVEVLAPDVGALTVSVSDTLTISDGAVVSDVANVEASDTLTIQDVPSARMSDEAIEESDNVAISDSSTVELQTAEIYESDSVTILDSPTVDPPVITIFESGTLTISDDSIVSITAIGVREISVADTVTVSDSPTARTSDLEVVESDTVTAADDSTAALQALEIQTSDSLTVSDDSSTMVALPVSVADSVTITATVRHFSDLVIIRDRAIVQVQAPEGFVYVQTSDTLTISDSATVGGIPNVATSDTVTLSDDVQVTLTDLEVGVQETVTVSDDPTVSTVEAGGIAISVADAVTVSDTPQLYEGLELSVQDGVTVSDTADASIGGAGDLAIAVSDGVWISDAPELFEHIGIAAADAVVISDAAYASISAISDLTIVTSDDVTVGDAPVVGVGLALVTASSVTIGESPPSVYCGTDLFIHVSETLTAGETLVLSIIAMKLVARASDMSAASAGLTDRRASTASLTDTRATSAGIVDQSAVTMGLTDQRKGRIILSEE